MEVTPLIIPAFIAGILTFLAPCTLPLVPGYLAFISGNATSKGKVFLNGLFYVIGFSAVFIALGSLFGLGGAVFFQYRSFFAQIGGIFVILFGLFLLFPRFALFQPFLQERHLKITRTLKPGNPASSLLFGSVFALGWSPCIGPILGTVLTLAASSATVSQGAFLLWIFSLGLAIPFLLVALAVGWASAFLVKIEKYLSYVSAAGGVLLIVLGILMVTNSFTLWIAYFYQLFDFINYDALLDYL